METQQSGVLCPCLQRHKGVLGHSQVDIWKGGEKAKSRPSSFPGVTWWVVGCIVCWTCVIAFVERLTENTQCRARPCLPETASALVENPETRFPDQHKSHFSCRGDAADSTDQLNHICLRLAPRLPLSQRKNNRGGETEGGKACSLTSPAHPPMKPHLVSKSTNTVSPPSTAM